MKIWSGDPTCSPSPCLNGECTTEGLDGPLFECNCENGYHGMICQNDPCHYSKYPCGEGICTVTENGYDCDCSE